MKAHLPVRRSLPVHRSLPVRPHPARPRRRYLPHRAPRALRLRTPPRALIFVPPPRFRRRSRLGSDPASVRLATFDAVVPARFRGAPVPARSPLRRFRHHRRHGGGGLAGGSVDPSTGPRARGAAALALVSATPSTSLPSSSVATTRTTRASPTTPSPTRMEIFARRPSIRRRSLAIGCEVAVTLPVLRRLATSTTVTDLSVPFVSRIG